MRVNAGRSNRSHTTKWLALIAGALLVIVAGCGGTSSNNSNSSTSTEVPDALKSLAAAAAKEDGPVIWYESLPPEDADQVIEAFNQMFPDITIEYQQLVGGVNVSSRIVQETSAGVRTADVANAAASQAAFLDDRGLLLPLDFAAMGVEKDELKASEYAAIPSQSLLTILYNTDLVKGDDIPQSWDDLLDPKWKGKIGTFVQGNSVSQMESAWGRQATDEYVDGLLRQDVRVFESNTPVAQAIASGELAVGAALYHPAAGLINAGAPLKAVWVDPVFKSSNWTFVTKASKVPNSAQLFIAWLLTSEGNRAYEAVTHRGSIYLDTESAKHVGSLSTAEWNYPADLAKDADAIKRYTAALERGERG